MYVVLYVSVKVDVCKTRRERIKDENSCESIGANEDRFSGHRLGWSGDSGEIQPKKGDKITSKGQGEHLN